jgi:type I restriction enzyme M protein
LNERDLADFIELSKSKDLSDNSWLLDLANVNKDTWDLTVNNPNTVEEVDNRTPQEIIAEIEQLDVQAAQALQAIKELL